MQNKPKLRNPYPAIDFEKAYNYLLVISEKKPHQNKFGRRELLEDGLGFRENNGAGHNVVGALGHYNLVRREGSKDQITYNITPEADRLLSYRDKPKEWADFAIKLSMSPPLFEYLYSKYPNGVLPLSTDTTLIKKYPEVNSRNVNAIIRKYQASLRFVNNIANEENVEHVESLRDKPEKVFEIDMGNGIIISVPEITLVSILKNHLKEVM